MNKNTSFYTYIVYWTQNNCPTSKGFLANELNAMLIFIEALRKLRKGGTNISHITSSSEDVNSSTLLGVDEVNSDYNWKKRR